MKAARLSAASHKSCSPARFWSTRAITAISWRREIHEQPEVVSHTLSHYLDMVHGKVRMPDTLPFDFR